jgi:hypothetical protein
MSSKLVVRRFKKWLASRILVGVSKGFSTLFRNKPPIETEHIQVTFPVFLFDSLVEEQEQKLNV